MNPQVYYSCSPLKQPTSRDPLHPMNDGRADASITMGATCCHLSAREMERSEYLLSTCCRPATSQRRKQMLERPSRPSPRLKCSGASFKLAHAPFISIWEETGPDRRWPTGGLVLQCSPVFLGRFFLSPPRWPSSFQLPEPSCPDGRIC